MRVFSYNAYLLPSITLIGKNLSQTPHQNSRRISEDYIWYLVTDGELYINESGNNHVLKKGDCFLFEPKLLHYGIKPSYHQFYYVHFRSPALAALELSDEEWFAKAALDNKTCLTELDPLALSDSQIILPKKMHIDDPCVLSDLIHTLEKAEGRRNIRLENYNTLCACQIQEVFVSLHRYLVFSTLKSSNRSSESTQRINEVITYLNTNYKRKLTGAIIEKELSYNFDYLNQLIRKNLDTTIFKMLESIRIEAAKSLIFTSNFSLEQISSEVGFKDETYFSKVFKKHTGFSPLRYKKQAQNGLVT